MYKQTTNVNMKSTLNLGCIVLLLSVAVGRELNDKKSDILFKPNQKSYVEGEQVTMRCWHDTYSGDCTWFQDDQAINFETNQRIKMNENDSCVISISPVTADDDSFWTCRCSNGHSAIKRLVIESKQIVQLIPDKPKVLHVEEGTTADLHCLFNDSAPYCFWTKDDNVLVIRGRYRFIGNQSEGNCSIRVSRVTHKDYGKYRCCYPIKEDEPVLKAFSIYLNITVIPSAPFIALNNVHIENEKNIFLVTETEIIEKVEKKYNYFQDRVLEELSHSIACWILNGYPEAKLRWKMEDENGDELDYLDYSQKPRTWDVISSSSSNLKSSYLELKFKKNEFYEYGIRRVKLVCSANHPSFKNVTETAFVWLIWAHHI